MSGGAHTQPRVRHRGGRRWPRLTPPASASEPDRLLIRFYLSGEHHLPALSESWTSPAAPPPPPDRHVHLAAGEAGGGRSPSSWGSAAGARASVQGNGIVAIISIH